MLDEPTNHLDFISENILIQALQQYKGSFVVVSHNRHFISQIANKIWYIEDKKIKEYPGTYDEYEYWRKKNAGANALEPEAPKPDKKIEAAPKPKATATLLLSEAKLKSLEKDLKKSRGADQPTGRLRGQHRLRMNSLKPEVYNNQDKLKQVQAEFKQAISSLDASNKKWEELATRIDEMSA